MQDMSFPDQIADRHGWSYFTNSPSPSNLYSLCSSRFDSNRLKVRKAPPVPVPNLTKKSRGRRVPTVSDPDSDCSVSCGVTKSRTFRCTVSGCGKCFLRGEHLKRHVRSIHTHDKPFRCTIPSCGKHFSRRDNLFQHLKIHKDRPAVYSTQSSPSIPQYLDQDDFSDYQRSSTSPLNALYVPPSFILPSTPSPSVDIPETYSQYSLNYTYDRLTTNTIANISSARTEPLSSMPLNYHYALSNDPASRFPLMQPSPIYAQRPMMSEIPSIDEAQFQPGQAVQYFYT